MNRKGIKIISLLLSFIIILLLITFRNIEVNADISNKPTFDVKIDSVSPNPALVGEDITVSGTITPQPFETTVPTKEVVLVLDVSGSMAGNKIKDLKEAAKNFINKMSGVPNLKIGIVTYSNYGNIKRVNNTALIKADDTKSLQKIIDDLTANGGTNTGDGLRRAAYLLNNTTNSNKTIVLMSDGEPTYRVSNFEWKWFLIKNELNFYKNISMEEYVNAGVFGTGNSDSDLKNTNYAMDIGKIINEKGYNVFSIGYGLSDTIGAGEKLSSLDKIKLIHASMLGRSIKDNDIIDDTVINEENGFYETSEGAIDSVFNRIADKIIDSYPINNVKLGINFNDGFSLNIGNNIINIGTITYNKKYQNGNIIGYKADPIQFSFKVKGNKIGENLPIYKKMEIGYDWTEEQKPKDTGTSPKVSIISNELPNINTELKSSKEVKVNENEELTLKYEIQPQSFRFDDEINTSKSDVVFVIDVSQDMGNYMNPLMNDIWNDILNNDKLKVVNTEYDVITFSNKVNNIVDLSSGSYSNYNQYITDLNENYIKKVLKVDNSNSKNIVNTYSDIIKLLDNGRTGTRKNVVFISETSNVSYGNEKDYGVLKSKGYNIITVEIENLNNGNNKNDLKNFHKDLGGLDTNYFYSKDQNDLQNNILANVANRIASNFSYNDYKFTPKLQIDLGGNFDLVSGGEVVDSNIASINVPEIIYKYSKTDNIYIADKSTVEFTLRPKIGKIGSLRFGSQNKLIYKKLIKDENKYSLVETPIIFVIPLIKNVTHGLYNGIISNGTTGKKEVSIQEKNEDKTLEIAQGSTVTFGSKFTLGGSSATFELNVDSNFNTVDTNNIKIYKILRDSSGNNTLTEIAKTVENNGENKFNISINNIKENNQLSDTDILVVYQGRVKEGLESTQVLKNEITFSNISKDVIIATPNETDRSPSLPDLF